MLEETTDSLFWIILNYPSPSFSERDTGLFTYLHGWNFPFRSHTTLILPSYNLGRFLSQKLQFLQSLWGFPWGLSGRGLSGRVHLQCRRPGFDPWVGKVPWRGEWQPTPVFLPGKLHGQRSLAGHSPWGRKESRHDWATTHAWMHAHTHIPIERCLIQIRV